MLFKYSFISKIKIEQFIQDTWRGLFQISVLFTNKVSRAITSTPEKLHNLGELDGCASKNIIKYNPIEPNRIQYQASISHFIFKWFLDQDYPFDNMGGYGCLFYS